MAVWFRMPDIPFIYCFLQAAAADLHMYNGKFVSGKHCFTHHKWACLNRWSFVSVWNLYCKSGQPARRISKVLIWILLYQNYCKLHQSISDKKTPVDSMEVSTELSTYLLIMVGVNGCPFSRNVPGILSKSTMGHRQPRGVNLPFSTL